MLRVDLLEDRSTPATITVTTLADEATNNGSVSLREAIQAANTDSSVDGSEIGSGADVIQFAAGLFSGGPAAVDLSIAGDSTWGPSALAVTSTITVMGPAGNNGLTIRRDGAVATLRLFYVTSAGNLTLENVTLSGGVARGDSGVRDPGGSGLVPGSAGSGGAAAGLGGAVLNEGTLEIRQSTLSGNTAIGGDGGDISGCFGCDGPGAGPFGGAAGFGSPYAPPTAGGNGGFASGGGGGGGSSAWGGAPGGMGGFGGGGGGGGNAGFSAGGAGGLGGFGGGAGGAGYGLYGLHGGGGGGAGMGGAVFNNAGTVTITNSTFSANEARGGLAGGVGQPNAGTPGQGLGGGVFNYNGAVIIRSSTLAQNTADQGGGAFYNVGDGAGNTGIVDVQNTILARTLNGATDFAATNLNAGSTINQGGYDLVQSGGGALGGVGNILGVDPQLLPLGPYFGPTWTMALSSTSPAIDAGSGTPPTDQRGIARVGVGDIGAFEANPFVVTTTTDVVADDGLTSLREAITSANAIAGDDTITFAVTGTITLDAALPNLSSNINVQGPGAASLTVARNSAAGQFSVFSVNAGVNVDISGVRITGGSAFSGGGIYNAGSLALTESTITGNWASHGGGIYSAIGASLSLSNCIVSDNTTGGLGGGVHNRGSASLVNCTITGNMTGTSGASSGGGIANFGTMSINNSTLASNSTSQRGGAIYQSSTSLTVTNCTFTNNSAGDSGGGIYKAMTLAGVAVTNSTFTDNSASVSGGGIGGYGAWTLTNSTLVGNNAGQYGGGIHTNFPGTATLTNAILWGNVAVLGGNQIFTVAGATTTANYSIVQGGWAGTGNIDADPLLAPLANYGGPTQTFALLPGSPAIEAGTNIGAPATDQRGMSRLGATDIGAFESQGFTISVTGGDGQATPINTAFAQPLVVNVASPFAEPVEGGKVVFTPPGLGASAILTGSPATIAADGSASVTATANGTIGQNYTVTASAAGTGQVFFTLSNMEAPSLVVTTITDVADDYDGLTSLREAINYANNLPSDDTITFSVTGTIGLNSALPDLMSNIIISGPGAANLTVERSGAAPDFSVFTIRNGNTVGISGLTISGGNNVNGGGIFNEGDLTLSNSVLSGNAATQNGGGLYNHYYYGYYYGSYASATLSNVTISGNTAPKGAGIYTGNGATLSVSDSTISNNTASEDGGGIYNDYSSVTVTGSTFFGNSVVGFGGAIAHIGGSLDVTNSTISGNTANFGEGGGLWASYNGTVRLTNCTVTSNSSGGGGGITSGGWVDNITLQNSIVANNSTGVVAPGPGPDVLGPIASAGNNLIGDTSGSTGWIGNDLQNVNPLLAPLANYGGPTQTMALLPGSPAINAGASGGVIPTTDQRGVARVGATDIGAFESQGFSMVLTGGDNQITGVNTKFANPLAVMVTSNDPLAPVAGGQVTFVPPGLGASAALAPNPATIAPDGSASATATANSTAGVYVVTAMANGSNSVDFHLTNNTAPIIVSHGGPYTINEGAGLNLTATINDPDLGQTLTVTWDVNGDGNPDATASAPTNGGDVVFNTSLTGAQLEALSPPVNDGDSFFDVFVSVDDGFASANAATTLTVNNVAPTATFSVVGPAIEKLPVTFSFTNQFDPSQVDVNAGFRYSYDFNNDGDFTDPGDIVDSTSASAQHTFANEGAYTVRGRIKDKDGDFTDYTTVANVQNTDIIVFGGNWMSPPFVRVVDAVSGAEKFRFLAFSPGYRGGVTVASGDVNGDKIPDIIAAIGGTSRTTVKLFNGVNGALLREFAPFAPFFGGGVHVAAGDVNGDGFADIVAGIASFGPPNVRVFDGKLLSQTGAAAELFHVTPYSPYFRGGVRVAAGDLDGDGFADVITGPGPWSTTTIRAYSGKTHAEIRNWVAFPGYIGGVSVAAGDTNNDGKAEIFVGQTGAWNAKVRVFDGATGNKVGELQPYLGLTPQPAGVRIAAVDADGDGLADLVVAPGAGNSKARIYKGNTLKLLQTFDVADPGFRGGVWVG